MSMALDAGFPAGWASLPRNLLDSIFDCLLPNSGDIVRFGAVCAYWRSVAWENFRRRQLPCLVVPIYSNPDGQVLYHVSTMVVDFEISLPVTVGLYGCCCGWLILTKANEVFLLDPYSGETIRPPPLERLSPPIVVELTHCRLEFSPFTQGGAALSASPDTDPDGYILMVTYGYGSQLAFIRAGDPNWTYVDLINDSCRTLTYHKGLFFALLRGGALLHIDVKSTSDFAVQKLAPRFARPPRIELMRLAFYNDASFVKHHDNGKEHLLMVLWKRDCYMHCRDFEIYKLSDDDDDGGGGNGEWTPVTNLGDWSLFLGKIPSFAFLPGGSQPNTIFFYDDKLFHHDRLCILGFNLEDGTIIFRPLDHIKKNIWPGLNPVAFVPAFI